MTLKKGKILIYNNLISMISIYTLLLNIHFYERISFNKKFISIMYADIILIFYVEFNLLCKLQKNEIYLVYNNL